jgi:hypothetical protein
VRLLLLFDALSLLVPPCGLDLTLDGFAVFLAVEGVGLAFVLTFLEDRSEESISFAPSERFFDRMLLLSD